jgi:hypothetical protein
VTPVMQARIGLAIIGIVVWGYGVLKDEPRVRLAGIIVLAVSLVLRFLPRRPRPGSDEAA